MTGTASVLLYTSDRVDNAGWLSALSRQSANLSLYVSDDRQCFGLNPVPQLIVLDLDVGNGAAFETLKWVRSQPVYAQIPVLAVTSPGKSAEIDTAYRLGVNSCLLKPLDSEEQDEIARGIGAYATLLHAGVATARQN